MQTQMTGHNVDLTPALKEFTEKKIEKLNAYADTITSTHITFNIEHLNQIVEAQLTVPGNTIHAKAESDNMYTAIDAMIDKLMRQLKKYKEKHTDHR